MWAGAYRKMETKHVKQVGLFILIFDKVMEMVEENERGGNGGK